MRKFIRFAMVGIASNALAYSMYLLLTYFGMGHKTAMSLTYVAAVAQSFYINRIWTFEYYGESSLALARYVAVYLFGYIFNLAILFAFVDRLGWSHRWVQGATILASAVLIFWAQKIWVFPASDRPKAA